MMSGFRAGSMQLFAAFLWGAGNVAQQTILYDLGPVTAVGFRSLIAAAALLPFVIYRGELKMKLGKPAMRLGALVSITFAAAALLQQMGSGLTTVGNASFLISTCAILTPVAAFILFRQRPSKLLCVAAFAVIIGACMISASAPTAFSKGDGIILVSAAIFAVWTICLSQFITRHGHPLFVIFLQCLTTGIICTSIGLYREPISAAHIVNAIPELFVLGVFSSGLAYLLLSVALSHSTASQAAIMSSAEAMFGALGGMILLGEHIGHTGLCGMALLMSGLICAKLPERWLQRSTLRAYSGSHAIRSAETTNASFSASL
jgi:drug/metabolite transporter (DMT)-like permease